MIIGIGTDIVQINRIEELYKKFGERFLHKNYHELEIEIFHQLNSRKKISFLAKRFAGKEAVAKALGSGIGNLRFKEIAIINDELGAPIVKIFNKSLSTSKHKIHISLSDDYPNALAFVVIS
jgi:holo-[acyl-carrier protein] synthase